MITLDKAIEIAKDFNLEYDSWEEYKDLYFFYNSKRECSYGGFGGPIVVLKKAGETRAFSPWAMKYPETMSKSKFITDGTC